MIDAIQRGILQVSQKEEPYDIFICYKETDEKGNRTRDSVLGDELYDQLTREGYRVFFARITLEDKLGEAYEPYLFAALHSARIMIVLGTCPENFQAVWVRNEWSRYLSLMKKGENKVLIPAYRDMDPYNLPAEFSHLQALDMSKLGFVQDLIRGVKKIIGNRTASDDMQEIVNASAGSLADTKSIAYQVSEEKVHRTGWEAYGWKRGVVLGIVLVLATILLNAKGLYRRWQMNHESISSENIEEMEESVADHSGISDSGRKQDSSSAEEEETEDKGTFNGILEEFVSRVFACPARDVTEDELAKIRQLMIERSQECWQIGYSFEAPAEDLTVGLEENEERDFNDEFVWMRFSTEDSMDLRSLNRFSGLKKLKADYVLTTEDVKGLELESICAYFSSPAEAAGTIGNPGAVRELGFGSSVESLDGIDLFENLEILYVDYLETNNIDPLIHADGLKNLTLISGENLVDFTVLGKLKNLESLRLEGEGVRTLDFVSGLERLRSLTVTDGGLQTLSGIEKCGMLEALSVTGCMDLKDMSAVSELLNLRELALEVPYGCPEPELDALTGLQKLSLEQFQDWSFIQNMAELTQLRLRGCGLADGLNSSELVMLESFQMLERLDLQGARTYEDISGLFRMPRLRELNISGMQCEIDFEAVPENPVLEVLHMDDMYLYENVQVNNQSGITMADWDEVTLDDHTDFLKKLPGLKRLYLQENGMTDLSFAEGLPALEVLDISDNYVTQLRPLAGVSSLRQVICPGNPLKNEKVLKDSVQIIGDMQTGM